MTLKDLQKQALELSTSDRWQLVQVLLDSLKQEATVKLKRGNLSRLRGIAKTSAATEQDNAKEDYVTYLTEKYQ
jgi:dihydroxyacid dehydratase/phosphogluconate dehydratase